MILICKFVIFEAFFPQNIYLLYTIFSRTAIATNELSAKLLSPSLCIAPLQCVPKILFTQATIDCLEGAAAYQLGNSSSRMITEVKQR